MATKDDKKTNDVIAPKSDDVASHAQITPTIDAADPDAVETPDDLVADDFADDEDLDSEDSLTFSNGVIEKIVALAVRDVDGVLGMKGGWVNRVQETFGTVSPTKGVTVEVTPDNAVRVNLSVLIEYGAYAPQIFEDVKKVVVKQIVGMTGLEVAGVNLRIEDVLTPDEYEDGRRDRDDEEVEK